MTFLANALTILSLICGFTSIIFSLENYFTLAAWAIILSVIFDGLDGQVARLNPIPAPFGKELDALVDVVAFGIAPSLLGYIFVCRRLYLLAGSVLFIYLLCSIIRLAIFNITSKEKISNYFYGLPTTASGGILASFILLYRKYTQIPAPVMFLLAVLLLSLLMVSRVKYPNLNGIRQILGKKGVAAISILAVIGAIFLPEVTAFALFLIYLTISPFIVRLVIMPR